jgi:hypothetical protein
MKSIGGFLGATAFAAALISSGPAASAPIQSIGIGTNGSFVVYFDSISPAPALSAYANVDIYNATSTQLVLRFSVTNDTAVSQAGPLTQASLMSIGLNFDPNPTGASLLGGAIFEGLDSSGGNFPGGFTVDICVFGANNCSGGDIKDGLLVQDLPGTDNDVAGPAGDVFRLTLNRASSNAAWGLNTAAAKFQTNVGSFEFAGCTSPNGCTPTTRVPEPGSLALVAGTVLAFAVVGWRRRRTR